MNANIFKYLPVVIALSIATCGVAGNADQELNKKLNDKVKSEWSSDTHQVTVQINNGTVFHSRNRSIYRKLIFGVSMDAGRQKEQANGNMSI